MDESSARHLLAEFKRHADGLLVNFTGREWLVERVRAWQADPCAKPFLLIQGTAGIGKSAFAAHLWRTQRMVTAVHFCIAGRGGTTEPLTFVEVISAQLAAALPGFAEARRRVIDAYARQTVQIEAEVQTGDVHPGGRVTGVAVQFRLENIPPEQAFDLLIRRPLREVAAADGLPPVLLLVDALDEALTHHAPPTILHLLQKSSDLPHQVRWMLTSRPEPRVTQALADLPVEILDTADPRHRADVRRYLQARIGELENTARAWGMSGDALVEHLGQRSEWNFLYLTSIWLDLAEGRIPSPERLPVGLDGYYRYLLDTRVGAEAWQEWAADLMEVLLALQEPVNLETLASFLGWQPRLTHQRVLRVAQVLSPALLQEGRYFRHHWSLAEFLRDRARAGPWWCDLTGKHRQIAERILSGWGGLEAGLPGLRRIEKADYGLRHLASHLAAASAWDTLYRLLTDFRFLEARCRATSVFDLEADYRLALAQWGGTEEQKGVLAAFEERLRLEEHHIAPHPDYLFPALYNHLTWLDAPDGPLHALCEAARQGRHGWLRCLWRSYADPSEYQFEGHADRIKSVVVSPSGHFIISGAVDGTIKLWNMETGRLLRSLEGRTTWVNAVAITLDDRFIVSGHAEHFINIWDRETGRLLRQLEGHTAPVWSIAVSLDGRRIASGSGDKTVKVWETETGRLLRSLEGHTDWVLAVVVSADGRTIVSGSADHTVKMWEAETGRLLRSLEGHTARVNAVAVSPDGRTIVSGSDDHTVKVWEAETGRLLRSLKGHTARVNAVAVSPNGRTIVSGSADHTVKVWEAETGRLLRSLERHKGSVNAVATSPDGRFIVSGSDDLVVRIWESESGRLCRSLEGRWDWVRALAISADGRFIVSGSGDGTLRIRNRADGRLLHLLKGHNAFVRALAVSADGRYFISGSDDGMVRAWDLKTGNPLWVFYGDRMRVNTVALSADGLLVVTGWDNGAVKVLEGKTGRLHYSFKGHAESVTAVALSADGRFIVSGSWDGTVKIWERQTGSLFRSLKGHEGPIHALTVSQDSRFVASSSVDKSIRIWDLQAGELWLVLKGHILGPGALIFNGDGRLLISGSPDRTILLWNLENSQSSLLFWNDAYVLSLSISGDESTLVCGDSKGRVWTFEWVR